MYGFALSMHVGLFIVAPKLRYFPTRTACLRFQYVSAIQDSRAVLELLAIALQPGAKGKDSYCMLTRGLAVLGHQSSSPCIA